MTVNVRKILLFVAGWRRPPVCGVCDFPKGLVFVLTFEPVSVDVLATSRFARSQTVQSNGLRQLGAD